MKIAIMGDSISQGIGSKKINYSDFLKENYNVKNFALTGTTIEYGENIVNEVIKYKPNIVVLFYGNVDALPRVRKDTRIYKILPKRYKKLGMLDPRALYSSKKIVKLTQKIDSEFRYRLKNFLIKKQGYDQWVELESFEKKYIRLVEKLKKEKIQIITISNIFIDEKYFNYSNAEYIKYNKKIKQIANQYKCRYIDIFYKFSKYNKKDIFLNDFYHPNSTGYKLIAKYIENEIKLFK